MNSPNKPPNRATITDRVAELLGEQPWPGYDDQSADAITTRLNAVDLDTARQARSYECDHKNRRHVLKAATRRIERG